MEPYASTMANTRRESFRHHFSRILLPRSDLFHQGRPGGVAAGAFVGTRSVYITHFLECTNVLKINGIMVMYRPPAHNSGKVPDEKLFFIK